jgi:hypothetical protein
MKSLRSLKEGLAEVERHWDENDYDAALYEVEGLLESWPGNVGLHVLWASLVQLQDDPSHGLDEVKKALQQAVALDKTSPAAAIELRHYLDAVEDNPQAASKIFSDGITSARRLLIDGLLGQARALIQTNKRQEAFKCLMESLYLANIDAGPDAAKGARGTPDILLRDQAGQMLAFQLKGPFAIKIDDLLQELFPKRSA